MEKEKKKRLVNKFSIPINHLDFAYIRECENSREMEKIVQVLRSGEEGHYPDLTKCAEDKLRELKPNSKQFRYEEPVCKRDYVDPKEWRPIYEWNSDIKSKDQLLAKLDAEVSSDADECLPPIRQSGGISFGRKKNDSKAVNPQAVVNTKKTSERIKSTDYEKWDKYDPDLEILRMDLSEEREQEEVERINRVNANKSRIGARSSDLRTADGLQQQQNLWKKLSPLEREKLAEEYRLRGNGYFRAKEYENALNEYNRSVQLNADPAAAVLIYNNRAITYIKMKKFKEAIDECERCLSLEPKNLKARLRLAEASYSDGKIREAYDLYRNVLELDSTNVTALKAIEALRAQSADSPPPNATRIRIEEDQPLEAPEKKVKQLLEHSNMNLVGLMKNVDGTPTKALKKVHDYDLAELVRPNNVVKSKLAAAAKALIGRPPKGSEDESPAELRMPSAGMQCTQAKTLIEEL